MKIRIKETNEVKTLSIIDRNTNWITDLMGNHNALPELDEEGNYIMVQEDYAEYQYQTDRINGMGKDMKAIVLEKMENACGPVEDLPAKIDRIIDESFWTFSMRGQAGEYDN